jgi:hypothetical protein
MNRKYFRLVSVAAVVLAITVATFPVEARSLSGSHATAHRTSGLWDAAVTWLGGLLPNGHSALRPAANATTEGGNTGGNTTGGHARPNTGSCIDPLGGHCAA